MYGKSRCAPAEPASSEIPVRFQASLFRHKDPETGELQNVRASENMGLFEGSLARFLENAGWSEAEIKEVTSKRQQPRQPQRQWQRWSGGGSSRGSGGSWWGSSGSRWGSSGASSSSWQR